MNKKQKEHSKIVEARIRKLITEIMNMVGFIFLTAFAVLGAIFYYTTQQPTNGIVSNLMISVVVVIFLWMMVVVKDKW